MRRPPSLAVWITVAAVLLLAQACVRAPLVDDPGRTAAVQQAADERRAAEEDAIVHIAVIGDSYTAGTKLGGGLGRNWVAHLDDALAANGVEARYQVEAAGGSGYVATGQKDVTFGQLVPKAVDPDTDLLIVFGSRNDSGKDGIREAAAATYAAATAIAPNLQLLVIGPPWVNGKVPPVLTGNRDAVRAAAGEGGATFEDPLTEGWFSDTRTGWIGSDGIHPTDAGHVHMAGEIAPHVLELLHS